MPLGLADADIDRRLAQQQRHQLAMDVADVKKRDVADRLEAQQLVLGQALLGESARPAGRNERSGRGSQLDKSRLESIEPSEQ